MARIQLTDNKKHPPIVLGTSFGPTSRGAFEGQISEIRPPQGDKKGYLADYTTTRGVSFDKKNEEGKFFWDSGEAGRSIWNFVTPPSSPDPKKFGNQMGVFKTWLASLGFPDDFIDGGGWVDLDEAKAGTADGKEFSLIGRKGLLLFEPGIMGMQIRQQGKWNDARANATPITAATLKSFWTGKSEPQWDYVDGNPNYRARGSKGRDSGFEDAAGYGGGDGDFNPDDAGEAAALPDPSGGGAGGATQEEEHPWD